LIAGIKWLLMIASGISPSWSAVRLSRRCGFGE